jgi:hypothetical protein
MGRAGGWVGGGGCQLEQSAVKVGHQQAGSGPEMIGSGGARLTFDGAWPRALAGPTCAQAGQEGALKFMYGCKSL